MAPENIDLAPGFRFNPSDEELINCYLKPRILGHDLPCNIIEDAKLYGPKSTPWQLFDVNDECWTDCPGKPEKYLYVFTTLSKLRCSESDKEGSIRENTRKKAGCGTWVARTKRKLIRDWKRDVIGEQRMLVFVINNVGAQFDLGKAGHFRMHEYSLCGVNKGLKDAAGDDVALCKITFNSSKEPVFKLDSKSTDGQDTEQSNNEENLERSLGDNLEGTMDLTPTSMVEMNSGFGDNVKATSCLTSENLFVMDTGVGDSFDCLEENLERSLEDNLEGTMDLTPTSMVEMNSGFGDNVKATACLTSENLFVMDAGVGDSFDCLEENLERILEDNLEGTMDLTPTSMVEMNSGFGDNVKATACLTSENLFVMDTGVGDSFDCLEENLERSLEDNLEGTMDLTPTSMVEMNSGFGDNVKATACLTSENLFVMDTGVGDSFDYLAVADQFDNGFQAFNEFGLEPSFDMDWFMGLMTSNQEEGAVEDISMLGKRRFEEEDSNGSKKMCL